MTNQFFISFFYHFRLIPEVYEIETENSELFGEFGSQEQHFLVLGNNHSNDSGTAGDVNQKLYMLLLPEELMVSDKEEAQSEEITAAVNDKQQGEKGNLGYNC